MQPWVEKHRPQTLDDVAGNRKAAKRIREWGENWEPGDKPLLLVGPAGTGKTSAALALADEMEWPVVEMNASDSRTKGAVERIGGSAATTGTLSAGGAGKRLVLIDEVDNLHGNKDRGGAGAMTRLVKDAQQPVIMIGNDAYSIPRGVKNKSEQIKFKRLQKRSVAAALKKVCKKEDIVCEREALDAISGRSDGDLRSAINDLESIATGGTVRVEDVEDTGYRDRDTTIFKELDTVLKGSDLARSRKALLRLSETPEDLIHWIDDNLPKVYDPRELATAYSILQKGDLYLGRTRRTGNYTFWGYANEMIAGVGQAKRGRKSGWTRYGFPSYWSRLGRTKKSRNTRKAISTKISEKCHVSTNDARDDFIPFLPILMENDLDAARNIVHDLNLTEDETNFLVDDLAEKLFHEEEEPEPDPEPVAEEPEEDEEEKEDESKGSQQSLLEF